MCVPNLKIVALPVCEILRESQNFKIGARAPGDAQFRVNLWSGGKNCPRPMCVPNLKIVAFFRLRNIEGVPKFRNWVTYPRPRQLRGQFVVRGQELPTAYVRTKFEGHSFIRLRNIGTFRCGALIDPVTLTFDLCSWSRCGSRMWPCDPYAKFRLPRPFRFRVRADVRDIRQTDGQTDRRTTDADDRLMPPPPLRGRGHNNHIQIKSHEI